MDEQYEGIREPARYMLHVRLVEEKPREDGRYTDDHTLGEYTVRFVDIPLDRFKRMVAIANGEEE